jgi:hypothetical protein
MEWSNSGDPEFLSLNSLHISYLDRPNMRDGFGSHDLTAVRYERGAHLAGGDEVGWLHSAVACLAPLWRFRAGGEGEQDQGHHDVSHAQIMRMNLRFDNQPFG